MTKRPARGSVLSRQKPKRSRKRGSRGGRVRLVAALLGVLAVGLVAALLVAGGKRRLAGARGPKAVDWKVSLKLEGDQPLADAAADEILALAKRTLGQGRKKDLQRTAAAIQRLDAYSNVHVLRLGADQAAVQVRTRTPVLCIEADQLRFVAADGSVYGTVEKAGSRACPGPILSGILEEAKAKLTLNDDFTLSLSDDEKAQVAEALELRREGEARGVTLAALEFKRYRGFFVKLVGQDLEVAMGRAPFGGKLDKLQDILAKLNAKGEQAVRIELDYQGKAFVKTKKM